MHLHAIPVFLSLELVLDGRFANSWERVQQCFVPRWASSGLDPLRLATGGGAVGGFSLGYGCDVLLYSSARSDHVETALPYSTGTHQHERI